MDENIEFPVATQLFDLSVEDVSIIDEESAEGNGWNFYYSGYITRPTVFQNKIFARVRDGLEEFGTEIEFSDNEVTSSCTCSRSGIICKHAVALLYSWVYDREEFQDIGRSLEAIYDMDRDRLIQIVMQILVREPEKIELFLTPIKRNVTEDISDVLE